MEASFKGRSVFDLKNRWHSHIKSKTVHDGTRFIYTESDPNCRGDHRKDPDRAILKDEIEPETSQALPITGQILPGRPTGHHPFTPEEDAVIMKAVEADPPESWIAIAKRLDGRTAWQCKERWTRYLRRRSRWTRKEDQLLVEKISEMGTDWAAIAPSFHPRSKNAVRSRWLDHLRPDPREISRRQAVFSMPQEDRTSKALLMNSTRDQMTTADE
jgi:hypothetical protein